MTLCLNNNCNGKSYVGTYIGETGRLLKFRINEHKKALLKEGISNSAMAAHFMCIIMCISFIVVYISQ